MPTPRATRLPHDPGLRRKCGFPFEATRERSRERPVAGPQSAQSPACRGTAFVSRASASAMFNHFHVDAAVAARACVATASISRCGSSALEPTRHQAPERAAAGSIDRVTRPWFPSGLSGASQNETVTPPARRCRAGSCRSRTGRTCRRSHGLPPVRPGGRTDIRCLRRSCRRTSSTCCPKRADGR